MKPWLRLTLITMTVGGGFSGVAVTLQALITRQSHPAVYYLLMLSFLGLFAFVTVSGLLFVQKPERTEPLIVALALQIPWISSPLLAYKFAAGFQVSVALMGRSINAGCQVGSDFQINLGQQLPWGGGSEYFRAGDSSCPGTSSSCKCRF